MRICYLTPNVDFLLAAADELRALGHEVEVNGSPRQADAVLLMSVSQMKRVSNQEFAAPLFVYNWDWYDWAVHTPRAVEYDWAHFETLCRRAVEVWNPSLSELARYNKRVDAGNGGIVASPVPYWTLPELPVTDGGFVLDTLRQTPDPYWGLAREACAKLGIPLVQSQHKLPFAEYCALLASCTMTVSTLREASTGGLGIVEAAWYGKPCVIPDNPENAASEYAPWGMKFKAGDVDSLAEVIKGLWDQRPVGHFRDEIAELYSPTAMARSMEKSLLNHVSRA